MRTAMALTVVLSLAGRARSDEKADALKQSIDLGELNVPFKLASAERVVDPMRGGLVVLKLEAKKDIDTSQLSYKAGFFDKDGQLHFASAVWFAAAFPLRKGESIRMEIWEGPAPQPWHRIALRKVDKSAE